MNRSFTHRRLDEWFDENHPEEGHFLTFLYSKLQEPECVTDLRSMLLKFSQVLEEKKVQCTFSFGALFHRWFRIHYPPNPTLKTPNRSNVFQENNYILHPVLRPNNPIKSPFHLMMIITTTRIKYSNILLQFVKFWTLQLLAAATAPAPASSTALVIL